MKTNFNLSKNNVSKQKNIFKIGPANWACGFQCISFGNIRTNETTGLVNQRIARFNQILQFLRLV